MITSSYGYGHRVDDEFHKYINVNNPFLPEISILNRLRNHSNIVELKSHSFDGTAYKLVFPFYETNIEGMNEMDIIRCISDISSAIAYCHRNRVLHRDIKPDNIVRGDNFKLIDFSNSVILDTVTYGDPNMTTYIYESPECALGKKISVLHDMWSFGITILELYTGKYYHELFGCKLNIHSVRKVRKIYHNLLKQDFIHHISAPNSPAKMYIIDTVKSCLRIQQDDRIRAKTLHRMTVQFLLSQGVVCEYKGSNVPLIGCSINNNKVPLIDFINLIDNYVELNFNKNLLVDTASKYIIDDEDVPYHIIIVIALQFDTLIDTEEIKYLFKKTVYDINMDIYNIYVKYQDQYNSILCWE